MAEARLRLIQLEEEVKRLAARVAELEDSDPPAKVVSGKAENPSAGQPSQQTDNPLTQPAWPSSVVTNQTSPARPMPFNSLPDVAAQPPRQAPLTPTQPTAPTEQDLSPAKVTYDNPAPRPELSYNRTVEVDEVSVAGSPDSTAESIALGTPAPTAIEPAAPLVDVRMVSHPDGSLVDRVSDMVIQTRAQGWPVVLVRSNLEDETWWAQQSIARRGQHIACRVHFGNQQSVAASQFLLVVLFLDTSEEAIRFRSAREFSEIPKGIRRSKEFRFIRK
jgi:hypothetical protein